MVKANVRLPVTTCNYEVELRVAVTILLLLDSLLGYQATPGKKPTCIHSPSDSISGTNQMTVRGVSFNNTLSFGHHNTKCNRKGSTFCLCPENNAHGVQDKAHWGVTQATLIAEITYASPSWRGFMKSSDTWKLKAIISMATFP